MVRDRSPGDNPGSLHQTTGSAKPRAGRLGSANKDGAPELSAFKARVRSTLRDLTVADCLTTASEASGGSFGDGP